MFLTTHLTSMHLLIDSQSTYHHHVWKKSVCAVPKVGQSVAADEIQAHTVSWRESKACSGERDFES